jgi:hypothetical protein
MNAVVVVCILLVLAGAVLALRWGHLDVARPWTDEDVGGAAVERVRRGLWGAAVYLYAGVASGLLVLGPGGRLVMRLLAVTAGDDAQGRVTEAEEIVGRITVGGTIAFVIFTGLFGGIVFGVLAAGLAKWLPSGRLGALAVAAAFAVTGATRLDPLRPDNEDFTIVGPGWVSVLSFVVLGALMVLTLAAVAGRLSRTLPLVGRAPSTVVPYLPLLLLLPIGTILAPAVVVGFAGVVLLGRAGFRRWWEGRTVLMAGRAILGIAFVALLPAFVLDVAEIL